MSSHDRASFAPEGPGYAAFLLGYRLYDSLQNLDLVPVNDEVRRIAGELLARSLMPQKAAVDALHVAAAAAASVDYLLTQNCRHIANAYVMPRVYAMLEELGVSRPLICTPAEFLEDPEYDKESDT